jgi:hypothetical protein
VSDKEIQCVHYRIARDAMNDTRLMAGTPQPTQDDGLLDKDREREREDPERWDGQG